MGEVLRAPFLRSGAVGELRQRAGGGGRSELIARSRSDQHVVAGGGTLLDFGSVGAPRNSSSARASEDAHLELRSTIGFTARD